MMTAQISSENTQGSGNLYSTPNWKCELYTGHVVYTRNKCWINTQTEGCCNLYPPPLNNILGDCNKYFPCMTNQRQLSKVYRKAIGH